MDPERARRWLVTSSLTITAATLMFFITAPVFDYPITWDQGMRVVEIILPVFLGYLGSATHFLFQDQKRPRRDLPPGISDIGVLLVRGPIVVFTLVCITTLFAFGYSNRSAATPRSGMSVDTLAWSVTSALGLLAVTTNVAASYLFRIERGQPARRPSSQGT